jgi:hypothetical protein
MLTTYSVEIRIVFENQNFITRDFELFCRVTRNVLGETSFFE